MPYYGSVPVQILNWTMTKEDSRRLEALEFGPGEEMEKINRTQHNTNEEMVKIEND